MEGESTSWAEAIPETLVQQDRVHVREYVAQVVECYLASSAQDQEGRQSTVSELLQTS